MQIATKMLPDQLTFDLQSLARREAPMLFALDAG